jgi:hypothetical protein
MSFAQKISRCSTFWLKKYPAVAGYSAKESSLWPLKRPPNFIDPKIGPCPGKCVGSFLWVGTINDGPFIRGARFGQGEWPCYLFNV